EPRPREPAPPPRETAPASPADVLTPEDALGKRLRAEALSQRGRRVLVSIQDRALWLLEGDDVALAAPVAVGKEEGFVWEGKRYDFTTPQGKRTVRSKATTPIWVPPDWHYLEIAAERELKPVHLKVGQRVPLSDSTVIEVRGKQVGRLNRYGNFHPFTPGMEIIFDGKIFVPPFGTAQRSVPEVLGTHKLELGDGYLIHGTNEEGSIGDAVSHGCVRMYNDDVARLFELVPTGTPVFIY
ncbi:MAG TPA: L,D-transpeptidase, partial [Longimicrobiales bacterium]|nr:L,D-transpeptidase [Longimicrobiales bacterium]